MRRERDGCAAARPGGSGSDGVARRTARRGRNEVSHVARAARQKLAAKHFKLKVLREARGESERESLVDLGR